MSCSRWRISHHWVLAFGLLIGWGWLKVSWEKALEEYQTRSRFGVSSFPAPLRSAWNDQLGQGASIAVLGGMRALVANYHWLEMTVAWENKEWFRLRALAELVTTLQPRSVTFWDIGAWHLAWNAAIAKRNNLDQPSELLRRRDERVWVEAGRAFLERGVRANPEKYELWFALGWLHRERRKDYAQSAHYFQEAWKRPGAPAYVERLIGYDLEKSGQDAAAYTWWRQVWASTTSREDRQRGWDIVEKKIRLFEEKLQIAPEKRVFPSAGKPQSDRS
jgi:hypothetical protein